MRVATVCMPFDVVEQAERREQIAQFLKEAAGEKAELIVFPEYLFVSRTKEGIRAQEEGGGFGRFAEEIPGGEDYALMSNAAAEHSLTIVYGALERMDDKHLYNTAVVIGPNGNPLGRHRKALLAPSEAVDGETVTGDEFECIATPAGKAAIITCYEIYFPEVACVYDLKKADFFVYIHADDGPTTEESAKARSRDHYMPLICSRYGNTGGAFILDNTGETAAAGDGAGMVAGDICLTERTRGRRAWNDETEVDKREDRRLRRRPELFRILSETSN